ncbi:MAG TPA: vitamin K epoxide reductase family protein [Verrucomicrobiae bacterium]|nr:vitamin K epoxide reductase family protein [Verrucomicrobiae bacterium]
MGLVLRAIITILCGVGLFASVFMLRKGAAAARGELAEPSVVQTPRARLLGGIPNAALGAYYYPALGLAIWLASDRSELTILLLAALCAAGVSVALAYSLLFVTKMPCVYCWTSHAINWTLALCLATLLFTS